MKIRVTLVTDAPTPPVPAPRCRWLKGLGALLSGGLPAAPTTLLAAPTTSEAVVLAGGNAYVGLIKQLAGPNKPTGWPLCAGRLLRVAPHPALVALLQATRGGDGCRIFALPKLSNQVSASQGTGLINYPRRTVRAPRTWTAWARKESVGRWRLSIEKRGCWLPPPPTKL